MCEDPASRESRKRPRASALSDVCKFTNDTFSFRNAVVPKHYHADSESESDDDDFAPSSDLWQRNEPIDVQDGEEEETEEGGNQDDSLEIQCNNNEDVQGSEKQERSFRLRQSPSPPPGLSEYTLRKINRQTPKTRELDNVLTSLQQAAFASSIISPTLPIRQQGVINIDDVESPTIHHPERTITVKVRTRSGIKRLQMKAGEPFGAIIIQLAKQEGVPEENIMLSLRDNNILGHDTPLSVNLSVADIIECIVMESKSELTEESDEDMIVIKVQGSESASKKAFRVSKFQKLEKLMVEYCQFRNLSRKKVVFLFDGDVLHGKETPEELDMEDENMIDVRIKK